MPKYIFLDTNILSDYTKRDTFMALSAFIRRNDYTIIVSSLLLVEIYNKGWEGGDDEERGARVVRFLSSHHCVIADPMTIWHREFSALPDRLKRIPIELDLDYIPQIPKTQALMMFLRRHQVFLDMGKDIAEWDKNYADAKDGPLTEKGRDKDKGWLGDTQRIIEDASKKNYLRREQNGRYTVLDRESFLASLDLRLSPIDTAASEDKFEMYLKGLQQIRAVRLTSLGFLYKYIAYDQEAKPAEGGSDLGDIYFMSVLPWCAVYTTDKNMLVTVKRAAVEAKCTSCRILGRKELEAELRRYKA